MKQESKQAASIRAHERDRLPSFGAVVIEDGAVLMVLNRYGWSFPKGHIEAGETPAQTAVREVFEETGVHVEVVPEVSESVPSAHPDDTRTITFFLARSLDGSAPAVPQAGEVQDAQWVAIEDVPERIRFAPDREAFLRLLAKNA